jgi:hypothetical protein
MQFYGSKEGLFHAILEQLSTSSAVMSAIVLGPRIGLGEQFTRAYLQLWEDPVTGNTLRSLTRASIGSQRASSLLRAYHSGQLRLSKIPEERRLGFMLAASQLLGVAVARYVIGAPLLVAVPLEELVQHLAPAIDKYLSITE